MFMMPMPPTMSDMPATQPSRMVIMSVVEFIMLANSSCERMLKSSSSASCMSVASFSLWLRRSTSVISSIAFDVRSSVIAEQVIPPRYVCALMRFITVVYGASTRSSWSMPIEL